MPNTITLSIEADQTLTELEHRDQKKHKKVLKTLGLMEANIRHPGLHTHEYGELKGPNGEKVFEAYVKNNTPSAYRIFWHYGPNKDQISIILITQHP